MYIRIAIRFLLLGSFVPLYGCYDESVPFTEEKVGEYDYQITYDPSAEIEDAFDIENSLDPEAMLAEDEPSMDASAPESYADASDDVWEGDGDEASVGEGGASAGGQGRGRGKMKDDANSDDVASDEGAGSAGGSSEGGSSEGGTTDEGEAPVVAQNPAPKPQKPANDFPAGDDATDSEVAKACGQSFKGKAKKVYMLKAEGGKVVVNADTVLAIKITGNKNTFNFSFGAGEKIAGLCIFAAGNQSQVKINSDLDMKQIAYVARGNQASAAFAFSNGHAVDSTMFDLGGHAPSVTVSGLGQEPCLNAKLGKQASMLCE